MSIADESDSFSVLGARRLDVCKDVSGILDVSKDPIDVVADDEESAAFDVRAARRSFRAASSNSDLLVDARPRSGLAEVAVAEAVGNSAEDAVVSCLLTRLPEGDSSEDVVDGCIGDAFLAGGAPPNAAAEDRFESVLSRSMVICVLEVEGSFIVSEEQYAIMRSEKARFS